VGWLRKSSSEPSRVTGDCALLLTTTRWLPHRVEEESAPLCDVETVRRWVRTLRTDQQVHVRRSWGAVLAVCDGKDPVRVFLADGEKSWVAEPPDATTKAKGGYADLTLEQVEFVMVDALTSPDRPEWPRWSFLV
jgi:hypothetical protein